MAGLFLLVWWGWVPAGIPEPGCWLTDNGAWISVDWTSQPVDEESVARLAEESSRRRMRYLYPFVTYVRPDGLFSPSYDHAVEFVAAFRHHDQHTRLLAWVGIPLVREGAGGIDGTVDLADAAARERIVAFAAALLDEAGFDGVHLDVETVRSGDRHYLLLLDEVRAAIGTDRILSVAAGYWVPESLSRLPWVGDVKWDAAYYRAVASRVDQIAVMSYDSMMPHPALYRLWLREQVRGIERALAGSDVELLYGLSVSREDTLTHRSGAENMGNGLAGICAGLARVGETPVADGIAVYAAWEADGSDWTLWEDWVLASDWGSITR